ncbi:MAG TPA: hypothetical protein VFH40_10875 [Gemmatimonadales bacterium]|jgi:hypothetical protein|nr:hypothetical protein [Gemmatimonadales bacterium]
MSRSWLSLSGRLAWRGLLNPRLGWDLIRTAWAFRRREWWAKAPFLPVPDRDYLRWRMYTAYADEDAVPPVEDVVRFARWRRETMGM